MDKQLPLTRGSLKAQLMIESPAAKLHGGGGGGNPLPAVRPQRPPALLLLLSAPAAAHAQHLPLRTGYLNIVWLF